MVKRGNYCIFNGNEYELTKDADGNLLILTTESSIVTPDFIDKYRSGVYTKKVKPEELHSCYEIKPYAIYENERVNIRVIKDNLVHLGTSDATLAKELSFERTDKYYYEKWVPIDDVKVFEERIEIDL